ncbi:hypothetical protein GCM10023148_02980 [Actinokineospora soli]
MWLAESTMQDLLAVTQLTPVVHCQGSPRLLRGVAVSSGIAQVLLPTAHSTRRDASAIKWCSAAAMPRVATGRVATTAVTHHGATVISAASIRWKAT